MNPRATMYFGVVSLACGWTAAQSVPSTDTVWVASDDPRDGPVIGAVPYVPFTDSGYTIPGFECITYETCPAGTALLDSSGMYGCGAGCTGSCTRCSGSNLSTSLCIKNPSETCYSSSSLRRCGTTGSGMCFTAPPGTGDNAGCGCTVPLTYPGGNCQFLQCLDLAGIER